MSILLAFNSLDDWKLCDFFCGRPSEQNKDREFVTGIISHRNNPDSEFGLVVYNVEYQSKKNDWNLYQMSVGSFFLEMTPKKELLVYNESGLANQNFDNPFRTFNKFSKPSEPKLRMIGVKKGDAVTVVYQKINSFSKENEIQAEAVYAGSPADLCDKETDNAYTALGGSIAFGLISFVLGYIVLKEWIRFDQWRRGK
ncbi:hypothetical protein [Leptospira meyeri]|uniref:hypothetical protein n=1 Tax=Leptospira meyeri TaxID=29508 RepID=UPI001EFA2315|nr:hypothetical protein [Leptospira meyeri]